VKKQKNSEAEVRPARERILSAAMEAFMQLGYADSSTLEIATRAQVSKRELYALFGNKQAMLAACVADRAGRMRPASALPPLRNRDEFGAVLSRLGANVLGEVSHPAVMAVFRLAIAEAQRAPEVAATLESARQSARKAVHDVLVQAQSLGLIAAGDPAEMGGRYFALLWGDLMMSLLLRLREAPGKAEIDRRVKKACEDFLRLYCAPEKRAGRAAAVDRGKLGG
jgi:AcrR family transcriptional regulator